MVWKFGVEGTSSTFGLHNGVFPKWSLISQMGFIENLGHCQWGTTSAWLLYQMKSCMPTWQCWCTTIAEPWRKEGKRKLSPYPEWEPPKQRFWQSSRKNNWLAELGLPASATPRGKSLLESWGTTFLPHCQSALIFVWFVWKSNEHYQHSIRAHAQEVWDKSDKD